MDAELIRKARGLAEETFRNPAFEKRVYHNLAHTKEVVAAVEEIGPQCGLSADELESAIVAAWLHDVGYKEGAVNHEANSARIAAHFLDTQGVSQPKIDEITDAINATRMPQSPKNMISKVVCDADLYHFSSNQCQNHSELLRQELTLTGEKNMGDMSDKQWIKGTIAFMEAHEYKTPYGQTVLAKRKKKNIKQLKRILDPEFSPKEVKKLEEEVVKLRTKLEKAKAQKPDRGIETMFRTTSHNHIMLSSMVDSKASILITINSIILSLVVSVLIRKLEENSYLLVPTVILISVCLATMVFSILASRPNVSSGKFTRDDIVNKKTNLLFFGNFHAMKLQDYEWGMKEMMKDADYLYGSLIKDIYYLGKVLGRKYHFLRIAYSIFMFGFVVAILSFIVAFQLSAKANL